MAGRQKLSTGRKWGEELLKTYDLQPYETTPSNSVLPVLNPNFIQADAQPRQVTVSGILQGAIDEQIISSVAGSNTEIQYNASGVFGASADLTWDDTGKELSVGGDLTAASFIPTSSTVPTNGVYLPATNSVAISASGTERVEFGTSEVVFNDGGENYDFRIEGDTEANLFFVDASTDRVGIGTTSPDTKLHVSGSGTQRIKVTGTGSANAILTLDASSTYGNYIEYGASASTPLIFYDLNASVERARVDTSGRLLVGTDTSPSASQGAVSNLVVQGYVGQPTSGGNMSLQRGQASADITNDQLIGRISFNGSDGYSFADIFAKSDANAGAGDYPGALMFSSNPGAPATSPSEAMRINSAQELLIGYTSDNGAYKLQVNSQIFATSATIATSDGRYKENVTSLNGCLDLVKALRPVSFTWKPQEDITRLDDEGNEVLVREGHNFPEGTQVGFIAQEVQEVLDGKPWLGSVIKENVRPAVKDNDGNELAPEEQFYGIAEGNLIAVLTNALQEAVGRIETLEAEVAALKS